VLVFLFKAKRGSVFWGIKGRIKTVSAQTGEAGRLLANPFRNVNCAGENPGDTCCFYSNIVNWSVYRQDVAERLRLAPGLIVSQIARAAFPRDLLR
jgi:hypothetical protein